MANVDPPPTAYPFVGWRQKKILIAITNDCKRGVIDSPTKHMKK